MAVSPFATELARIKALKAQPTAALAAGSAGNPYGTSGLKRFDNPHFNWMLQQLQGAGDQSKQDIDTGFSNALNRGQMQTRQRGLGGTTIMPLMRLSAERQKASAKARVDAQFASQKAGMGMNFLQYLAGQRQQQAANDAQSSAGWGNLLSTGLSFASLFV